jgi:indole-3-glycerol phosphate synthase
VYKRQLLESRKDVLQESGTLIVSESGLHTPEDLRFVKEAGAESVLIGESLVKQPDPAKAIAALFSN